MLERPLNKLELLSSGARTTSGNSGEVDLSTPIELIVFELEVSAVSGTLPTLDVYVQQRIGGNWVDIAHFQQLTATTTYPERLAISDNRFDGLISGLGDGTLAANSKSNLPLISRALRVKYNIGGTSPSFTFSVVAYYL